MNRIWLCTASACLLSLPLFGRGDSIADTLVNSTPSKAVVIENTATDDAHYAIGWSFVRVDPGKKAVDWTTYDSTDPNAFLDRYDWDSDAAKKPPYRLFNCVIDLTTRKILELPSTFSWMPRKGHGEKLYANWSQAPNGTRHGLVENEGRFGTWDLWLVTIDHGAMRFVALTPQLDKAVGKILEDKRPLNSSQFETDFPVVGDSSDSDATIPPAAFAKSTVTFSFQSDIPKHESSETAVSGIISINLADAKVLSISSSAQRDDPFQDNPALAQADRDLNEVYARLKSKLDAAGRATLQTEQLAWIGERNREALGAADLADYDKKQAARDDSLRTTTQKRTEELRKRL